VKKYKIINTIVFSFIVDNEQRDILFNGEDQGYVEATDTTVWYITKDGERYESTTTANIIDVGLKRMSLEEIENGT